MKNKWLLFGPGGIGRGLIAPIAYNSNHQIIFSAPVTDSINFLKANPSYEVKYFSPEGTDYHLEVIKDYGAVLSTDLNELTKICLSPELKIISTSVRVDNLESVAKALAPALKNRQDKLIILVCENVERGGSKLKEMLEKEISGVTKNLIIPNISVDSMIPPHKSDSLVINREEFGELVIEKPADNDSAQYLANLPKVRLIEGDIIRHYKKKIIGVSGIHAGIAWLSLDRGHEFVYQGTQDPNLKPVIDGLIQELNIAIQKETGFSASEILPYLELARKRVGNANLPDPNERFFRNLRTKLSVNERFLGPALTVWQQGQGPTSLLKIIAIGFKKLIKDEGLTDIKQTVHEVCELPPSAKELEDQIVSLI